MEESRAFESIAEVSVFRVGRSKATEPVIRENHGRDHAYEQSNSKLAFAKREICRKLKLTVPSA